MPEGITAESLMENIVETITDGASKHKDSSFFEGEKSDSVTSQFKRLFGREKSVHHVLGGGKSADVLLWRNEKISASVLAGATVVWVIFEWLNYNFLSISCFVLVIALLLQFLWKNASGILNSGNSSPSDVPRLHLPEDTFANIGKSVGYELNRGLSFLQDTACEGTLKQFLVVIGCLWAAAIIGSWYNFLTVLYVGFVAAHTLPVLYERYEDEVDSFGDNVLQQLRHNYRKLAARVLSQIPKSKLGGKKFE